MSKFLHQQRMQPRRGAEHGALEGFDAVVVEQVAAGIPVGCLLVVGGAARRPVDHPVVADDGGMRELGADFDPARYDVTLGTAVPYASMHAQQVEAVL